MGYFTAKNSKLYPSEDTKILLNKTMGCCRFVWNQLLGRNITAYNQWAEDQTLPKPGSNLVYFNQELNRLKKEYPWLNEVSAVALQQITNNLSTTFTRFFTGKGGFPRFKSKRDGGSFKITGRLNIVFKNGNVKIPKAGQLTTCRPAINLEERISGYSVIRDGVGDYFIKALHFKKSILNPSIQTGKVGIDLGIKSLAVVKPLHGDAWDWLIPELTLNSNVNVLN